ncbi:hypothetical protein ACFL6I_09080 [candidate division KSB1 bacterium]
MSLENYLGNYTGCKKLFVIALITFCTLYPAVQAYGQQAGQSFAILIGGLGGEPQYTTRFNKLLLDTHKALTEQFMFPPGNIKVFAESVPDLEQFVDDISSAENITAAFRELESQVTGSDHAYVILFGHGSYDGKNAKLNIPRRDLSDEDFAEMLNRLDAGRIIFINTASSSFPFIQHISGENRIVITATKSPTQRNITEFPEYLVEGFSEAAADLDKNGSISVLEIFTYAALKTERFYSDNNHLATEHAMLEDNGDGQAFRVEELMTAGEGALSGATYLKRRLVAFAALDSATGDTTMVRLLTEQEKLELEISTLKNSKDQYSVEQYYLLLEELLVKLARVNDEIEKLQNIH